MNRSESCYVAWVNRDNPFVWAWPGALIEGRFLRRYHRFLSDIEIDTPDGPMVVVAHCVNSGRMEGLVKKHARVWLTANTKVDNKLKYTWQVIELNGVWIGANTSVPNPLVKAMLAARVLPGFEKHEGYQAEVAYGTNSRVDFSVVDQGRAHLLEVKNIHLVYPDGGAYFPDSVSERATKHLHELTALAKAGEKTTALFVIQREDAKFVRPSDVHDKEFAVAARAAKKAGVNFRAIVMAVRSDGLHFAGEIPVDLEPYDTTDAQRWMEELKSTTGWERPKSVKPAASEGDEKAGAKGAKAKVKAKVKAKAKTKVKAKPKVKAKAKIKPKVISKAKPKPPAKRAAK